MRRTFAVVLLALALMTGMTGCFGGEEPVDTLTPRVGRDTPPNPETPSRPRPRPDPAPAPASEPLVPGDSDPASEEPGVPDEPHVPDEPVEPDDPVDDPGDAPGTDPAEPGDEGEPFPADPDDGFGDPFVEPGDGDGSTHVRAERGGDQMPVESPPSIWMTCPVM